MVNPAGGFAPQAYTTQPGISGNTPAPVTTPERGEVSRTRESPASESQRGDQRDTEFRQESRTETRAPESRGSVVDLEV